MIIVYFRTHLDFFSCWTELFSLPALWVDCSQYNCGSFSPIYFRNIYVQWCFDWIKVYFIAELDYLSVKFIFECSWNSYVVLICLSWCSFNNPYLCLKPILSKLKALVVQSCISIMPGLIKSLLYRHQIQWIIWHRMKLIFRQEPSECVRAEIVPISSSLCVLKGCKLMLFNSCFF